MTDTKIVTIDIIDQVVHPKDPVEPDIPLGQGTDYLTFEDFTCDIKFVYDQLTVDGSMAITAYVKGDPQAVYFRQSGFQSIDQANRFGRTQVIKMLRDLAAQLLLDAERHEQGLENG